MTKLSPFLIFAIKIKKKNRKAGLFARVLRKLSRKVDFTRVLHISVAKSLKRHVCKWLSTTGLYIHRGKSPYRYQQRDLFHHFAIFLPISSIPAIFLLLHQLLVFQSILKYLFSGFCLPTTNVCFFFLLLYFCVFSSFFKFWKKLMVKCYFVVILMLKTLWVKVFTD